MARDRLGSFIEVLGKISRWIACKRQKASFIEECMRLNLDLVLPL